MPTALGFLNTTAQQLAKTKSRDELIRLFNEYEIDPFQALDEQQQTAAEGRFGLKGAELAKVYNDSRVYELALAIYNREAKQVLNHHAQYATEHSFKTITAVIAVGVALAGALAATPVAAPVAAKAAVGSIPALYGMYKAASMFVYRVREGELRSKQHMLEHHVYLDVRKDPHGDGHWVSFSDDRGVNQRAREPVRLNAEALKRTQAIVAKLG